jgi:hypothetical protein
LNEDNDRHGGVHVEGDILGACPTKRLMSRDEEFKEASEQSRRSLSKNLIRSLPMQDH